MPRLSVLFLLLLGACASVTTGTTQTIAIESEPPGAACALQRAGDTIARVSRTPADVTVTRASIPIDVDCSLENHLPGRTTVPSGIQAMTFGNVLIGGVIGVVVDAASGAIHSYPDRARVDLSPESFTTVEARDAYFEARRARLQAALGAVQAQYADQCGGGDRNPNAERCAAEMDSALAQAERALERVETERLAARIAPEDAAQGASIAQAPAPADPPPAAEAQAEAAAPAGADPAAPSERSADQPAEPTAQPPADAPFRSAVVESPAQAPPQTLAQSAPPASVDPAQEPTPAAKIQQAETPAVAAPPAERWRVRLVVKTPIVPRSWCRPGESGEAEFAAANGRSEFKLRSDNSSIATVTARLDDPDGPALRFRFRGQSSPRPFSITLPQPAGQGAVVERTVLYTHSYTPCEYTVSLERLTPERPATVAATAGGSDEPEVGAQQADVAAEPAAPDAVSVYETRLSELEALLSQMRAELARIKAQTDGAQTDGAQTDGAQTDGAKTAVQ